MKILFEHSQAPLPVKKYGGTERQLFWLMKALVKEGHQVWLIGHPESQVASVGVLLIPNREAEWRHLIPKEIDLIHLFYSPSFSLPKPFLVTIEGNGKPGEIFPLHTVFVSRQHARLHGSQHFVYNGIDLSEYPFDKDRQIKQWNHFLFLAKAKWKVKNLKGCVSACRKAKKHLHIAGGHWLGWSRYIHSYGMTDQDQKKKLLQQTDALLFPVLWEEPFGIAVIEAMAMGLPIIASHFGSLPEIIPSEGGWLCHSEEDFQNAIEQRPQNFDSHFLRNWVENHFSIEVSCKNYLAYYEKILSQEHWHLTPPSSQFASLTYPNLSSRPVLEFPDE